MTEERCTDFKIPLILLDTRAIIVWASMALSMPRLSILALVAHAAAAFNTAGVLPLRMPIRTIAASNGR